LFVTQDTKVLVFIRALTFYTPPFHESIEANTMMVDILLMVILEMATIPAVTPAIAMRITTIIISTCEFIYLYSYSHF